MADPTPQAVIARMAPDDPMRALMMQLDGIVSDAGKYAYEMQKIHDRLGLARRDTEILWNDPSVDWIGLGVSGHEPEIDWQALGISRHDPVAVPLIIMRRQIWLMQKYKALANGACAAIAREMTKHGAELHEVQRIGDLERLIEKRSALETAAFYKMARIAIFALMGLASLIYIIRLLAV